MIPEGEASITLTSAEADVFVSIAYFASPNGLTQMLWKQKIPLGAGFECDWRREGDSNPR